MNLFRYLKNFKLPMLFMVIFLVIRAFSELQLPTYTSNIVNVGIQQNGIEDTVPSKISEKSLNELELFMTDDEINSVKSSYDKDGDNYVLKNISDDERTKLNSILEKPMFVVYGGKQQGSLDTEKIAQGVKLGVVKKDTLIEQRNKAIDDLGSSATMMTKQGGISYVKAEYEKLGIDIHDLRMKYIYKAGSLMLLVTLISAVASIVTSFISSRTAATIGRNLRSKIYKRVMSFSKNDIDKFSTASLLTRSTNDIQQVQTTLAMSIFIILFSPIMAIGGIYKVLQTDTGMSWIIAVGVGVLMTVIAILLGLAIPKFKIMQTLIDRVNLISREILTGLSVIRVFGREKHEEKRFDEASTTLMNAQLFTNRVMSFFMPAVMLIMNAITIVIIWVGGKNIDAGNIQVGDMLAFLNYTMQIVMSFLMLTMLTAMLPRASVAAGRIDEVLATEVSIKDKEHVKDAELKDAKGIIKFDNVSLTFPDAEHPVLENISFEARPGETTAIIGSTGSGKSTLIHLIPRFFDVSEGAITIDGVDIRDISLHKLRELQGFVPQKGVLFSGDIRSNIKFGDDDLTDEQVKEAAKIAQALEFIEQKEDKYESHIAQGGSNVSGGQKQRLSIARAIARKPRILLFDDSFSALDYKTDVKLRASLNENMKDTTTLIVAQRVATIMHAEQIIVLNEGKIEKIGTHEELLETSPTYREIAESQLSKEELEKGGKHNG